MVQRIVDSIGSPATVSNARGDYLTANALGRALYAPLFDSPEQPPNAARFAFLDRAAQQFVAEREKAAKDLVAALRFEAGCNPHDRALTELVGELSTRSEPFAQVVARPQRPLPPDPPQATAPPDRRRARPRLRSHGALSRQRPAPGRLSAEPGSRSAEALDLLASWTATPEMIGSAERSPEHG